MCVFFDTKNEAQSDIFQVFSSALAIRSDRFIFDFDLQDVPFTRAPFFGVLYGTRYNSDVAQKKNQRL